MYFQSTFAHIEGNPNLREPQIQAYRKIKEYFEEGNTVPALANLPTGAGKTGLMAILPFGIAKERVLIITPNTTIRGTVTDSLDPRYEHNFWWNRKVINIPKNLPEVIEYEGNPNALSHAKIVITNIHRLMQHHGSSLLKKVPNDFFDMIIIDEAHHSPANSWIEVEQYFDQAKIVKITGTPFRTDRKEIYAEEVYSYSLGRAMVKGYVKNLVKKEFIPEELTFKVDGIEKELTVDEVLAIKDQDWISRTVAYSPHCSVSVVKRSIEIMQEKRNATEVPHKIIAVACSIEHAKEIKQLYEENDCPCSIVHSGMAPDEIEMSQSDFHNDRTHAIVNVGMLGEGYDHPYISIAAIFRPFRSKSAYAQFAGRALRAIPDAKDPLIDNVAHLVYHSALDLEELWDYYKKEQQKAEIIQDLENSPYIPEDEEEEEDRKEREPSKVDIGIAEQSEEYRFSVDTFIEDKSILQEYERALEESKLKTDEAVESLKEKGIPITDDLIKLLQGSTFEDITKSKRPDLELKELRRELTVYVQERVAEIITRKGLDPKAPAGEIAINFRKPRDKDMKLDGFCVKFINDYLRRHIGYPRDKWSIDDYRNARPVAEKNLDYLEQRI